MTFDPLCWCGFPIEENVLEGETLVEIRRVSPAYGGSWKGAFIAVWLLVGIDGTTSPDVRNGFVSETKLSVDVDTG